MKNKITPCIWFDGDAQEAAELYCTAFENSKIVSANPMVVVFELGGDSFSGLNGGPMFAPNASVSFFARLDARADVDRAAEILADGGEFMMPLGSYPWSERYAWVQDRFGVSWQLFLGTDGLSQRFSPTLMFTGANAGRAEEAINFYTAVFDSSKVISLSRYVDGEPDTKGSIKHGIFMLGDNVFRAMDSSMGSGFPFSEGISLVVHCHNQNEIDHYWENLTAEGGVESQCGWLKDKFGVSWQIVPTILAELVSDPEKAPRVVEAFMGMGKFDIERLREAAR
jgi:predicted 3-demethylubiquinone-9 3-methyltransferase (glyoxalase superfamily)